MAFTLRNIDYGANRTYEGRHVPFGRMDLVDNLGISKEEIVSDPVLLDQVMHVPREYFKIVKRDAGIYDLVDYSRGNVCVNSTPVIGGVARLKSMDVIRCGPKSAIDPSNPNDPKGPLSFYFLVNGDSKLSNEELALNTDIHTPPTTQNFLLPLTLPYQPQTLNQLSVAL